MIRVVAVITAKPGHREDILKLFCANMPAVHAEAGCVEYQPFVDVEGFGAFQAPFGPDTLIILETWESEDALKAHAVAPHMATYAKATKEFIETRKIHILKSA